MKEKAFIRAAEQNKTDGDNPVLHVFKAGGYSLHGLGAALKHEMAFRIEVVCFVVLLPLAVLMPVGPVLSALVISSMLLVLLVELLNSAMEWTVDYISLEQHPFAKRAKDIGSAAVMISLLHSGLWWSVAIAIWQGWMT